MKGCLYFFSFKLSSVLYSVDSKALQSSHTTETHLISLPNSPSVFAALST